MKTFFFFVLGLTMFAVHGQSLAQRNWVRLESGTGNSLNGVYFSDANTGTVVGDGGIVLRTLDGGQSWIQQDDRTNDINFFDVFFLDANTGWAVGRTGTIIRTTNGGSLWDVFQDNQMLAQLNGVFFVDSQIGTVVGSVGNIWRSDDGGNDWATLFSGSILDDFNDVAFGNTSVGIAVGGTGTIWRTTDGGQTWDALQTGLASNNLYSVSFGSANTVTTVGQFGIVHRSTDGGQTWVTQSSGVGLIDLNGVSFSDEDHGTAVGQMGTIISTSDGGATWNRDNSGSGLPLNAVHFADANNGWAVGINGAILKTETCDFSISPVSKTFNPEGGSGTVNVTTESGCFWTATTQTDWINITDGFSGDGNGMVSYAVDVNNSSDSRTGIITIADQTFTVTQSECIFAISPTSASFQAAGGAGAVSVTTQAACTWTAESNVSWVMITSGGSGEGSGNVAYSVEANNSPDSRSGTLTVAAATFTIAQAGASQTNQPPVLVNTIADQTLNLGDPPFRRDLDASPVVFVDPDGDSLTYSVSSSEPAIATATVSGSILSVSPVMDGTASIFVTARDFLEQGAETAFMVTVTSSPPACWEVDHFDNLNQGPLNGQNGWTTVPDRAVPDVVADPFGPGQVLLLDPQQNQTVNIGKNVNDQIAGRHSIKLNVRIGANVTEPSLAKVEIRTTGNPNWDKKFQLYFGSSMRLNYGPARNNATDFVSAAELVKGHEYLVEAIIDLGSDLVKVLVDGQTKLDNVAVGPGAITDISISAWDRPGLVYFDNLEFCSLGSAEPGECPVRSFFDINVEGWSVIEDVQDPVHFATGGNPGGYISATDIGTGRRWFWQAPAKFLGDRSCAYGSALNFDLRHIANNHSGTGEDIKLEGAGLTLVYDTNHNPDQNWTAYSVSLLEDAGWRKDNLSGEPPTQAEMQAVLSSLTNLFIRGEFSPFAGDIGHLDNVILGGPIRGVGPATFLSATVVNDDGKIEPGEQVELVVTLRNQGIDTVTDITGVLTTSDPDVTIVDAGNSWPNLPAGASESSLDSFGFEVSPDFTGQRLVEFTLKIMAGNGGPWQATFELLVGVQTVGIVTDNPVHIPTQFSLAQNYPNPFNPATTISFGLPKTSHVKIELFNLTGQTVAILLDERKQAGYHSVRFDGSELASGVYFYRLVTKDFSSVKKMVFIR